MLTQHVLDEQQNALVSFSSLLWMHCQRKIWRCALRETGKQNLLATDELKRSKSSEVIGSSFSTIVARVFSLGRLGFQVDINSGIFV